MKFIKQSLALILSWCLALCTVPLGFRVAVLLVFGFSMIGCSAKRIVLVPAPDAKLAAEPNSAQASDEGVSVLMQANAWDGYPRTLERDLIPIKVTIRNTGGHDVAIRYEDFALVTANNHHYSDIPPDQIRGYSRELLEPYWAYSDAEQRAEVQLPTEAMVKRAMSQGVVVPGGETSGFLYFPRPTELLQTITFRAFLVDAETKQQFGSIVVPLLVRPLHGVHAHSSSL